MAGCGTAGAVKGAAGCAKLAACIARSALPVGADIVGCGAEDKVGRLKFTDDDLDIVCDCIWLSPPKLRPLKSGNGGGGGNGTSKADGVGAT